MNKITVTPVGRFWGHNLFHVTLACGTLVGTISESRHTGLVYASSADGDANSFQVCESVDEAVDLIAA